MKRLISFKNIAQTVLILLTIVVSSFGQFSSTVVLKKQSYYETKYQDHAFSLLVPEGWNFNGNNIFGPAPNLFYNTGYEITNAQGNAGIMFSAVGQRYIWATPNAGPVGQLLCSMQGQLYNGLIVNPVLAADEFYYQFIYRSNTK